MFVVHLFKLLLLSVASFGTAYCDCLNFPGISCNPEDVKFYLYPNPSNILDFDELPFENLQSIVSSRYDTSKSLVLLTHGFTQTFQADFPAVIKNAYLRNGFASSLNIVAVDWGRLSGSYAPSFDLVLANALAELPQYIAAVGNVKVVGQRIADFLIFLSLNHLASASRVHLIGQSLGAHASGYAGSRFESITGQPLARVTGTDPAGPLFFPPPFQPLIKPDVASFVDIVHTNRGVFGYLLNLGQVDFNVNGGGPFQPGCTDPTNLFCAHNTAPHYYAQSIANRSLIALEVCLICGSQSSGVIFGEFCPPGTRGLYNIQLENN